MGKYSWHVAIKDKSPDLVRHYNHVSKLYTFILRKPQYFKDKTLTLYSNDQPVINIDWDTVVERQKLGLKETEERKHLFKLKRENVDYI